MSIRKVLKPVHWGHLILDHRDVTSTVDAVKESSIKPNYAFIHTSV